jgi:zinc protease
MPNAETIFRQSLANGLTLLVWENPTVQSVVLSGSLQAGALAEPASQRGLANLIGATLMDGTPSFEFNQLHERLESIGASLQTYTTWHDIHFSGKCLSEDVPFLLDLLAEVLQQPTFPQPHVERRRGEMLTYLKIRQTNTRAMAGLRFNELVYPPHHAYHEAIMGTEATLQNLTLADLHAFHQRQFGPQGMILVVAGNVRPMEILAQVTEKFGAWYNPHWQPLPTLPEVPPLSQIVHTEEIIPGKSQADLVIGVAGPSRFAPDYQAARIANHIFGVFGMFGRLGKHVRENHGLAYYCYSQVQGGLDRGAWRVLAGVDPDNISKAVRIIRDEITRMLDIPVSAEELADSQSNLIGSLPLQLETNEGVAATLYNMERYQLGLDYLKTFSLELQQVSVEDVQTAMQNYWGRDAFAVAVAGPSALDLAAALDGN